MDNNSLFGNFLKEKRQEKGLSLRNLSNAVCISHSYLYNIEIGKKAPPNDKDLQKIAIALCLDEKSKIKFFDYAALCKYNFDNDNLYIPVDISSYIIEEPSIKGAIRKVSKKSKKSVDWDNLLND